LDFDRVLATNGEGIDVATSLPPEWECKDDLEMYMVVMLRMANRLAAVMFLAQCGDGDNVDDDVEQLEVIGERALEPSEL
jgi:hypothetical protein